MSGIFEIGTIYTLIRLEREKQGITQLQLACDCGTSMSYISNLEHGKIDARWSTLKKVLTRLDIKLFPDGYLFNI